MKVALCGAWHVHAADYTKTVLETPGAELVGVWESDAALLAQFLKAYPDTPVFESLDALCASEAEGVIVCAATNLHADCMCKIAEAKKHIFTEKVLALTTRDCLRVKEAVESNGVRFVISLVWKYHPGILTVKKLLDEGCLGDVNFMRFRNCHSGSICDWLPQHFYHADECGGGAMIDLGAHGMYLVDWIMGVPEQYASAFTVFDRNEKNADRLEDNAVTLMRYGDGRLAINETGFVSLTDPLCLEVSGTKGHVRFALGGDVELKADCTQRKVEAVEQEAALPSPIAQFLSGESLEGCGIEEAVRLTKMMECAYKSAI